MSKNVFDLMAFELIGLVRFDLPPLRANQKRQLSL